MARLPLSMACGPYEITRALIDGSVQPDGIALTVLTEDLDRIFRLDRRDEVDICEFNVMSYFRHAADGHPIVAIPVFTHRRFRHGSIFVRSGAGIDGPADLAGKRVIIGGYEPAAAIWIRGMLSDEYGVGLGDVEWIDVFGRLGRLPDGQAVALTTAQPGSRQTADACLLDGRADAMISAYMPEAFLSGDKRVRRLFDDPRAVEMAYFQKTGIFPIMHVITIKRAVTDAHGWVPESVAAAFTKAKKVALERLRNPRVLPLASWQYALEEQTRLMGPDPWEYGLTGMNTATLRAALRYAEEQGICRPGMDVESLFLRVENVNLASPEFV